MSVTDKVAGHIAESKIINVSSNVSADRTSISISFENGSFVDLVYDDLKEYAKDLAFLAGEMKKGVSENATKDRSLGAGRAVEGGIQADRIRWANIGIEDRISL